MKVSHSYGTFYYTETEYYEGEWYENKRNGWGRMYYEDGSVYEGRYMYISRLYRSTFFKLKRLQDGTISQNNANYVSFTFVV